MRITMRFDRMLYTTFFMLLALLALAQTAHCQAAYSSDRDAKLFNAQGQTYTINNRIGAVNLSFEYVVSGSPGSLTMTITGCMRGGTCDVLDIYIGTASSIRKVAALYDSYTVAATTLSGGSTPTVQMNAYFTASSSPTVAPWGYKNISGASTGTAVKGTNGIVHAVNVNTQVANATVRVMDLAAASCTGSPTSNTVALITLPAAISNPFTLILDSAFQNGICVTASGATDVTVAFQ